MANQNWGDICSRVDTCALTGAAAFFAGIPDAHIIVNGPNWCYFYALRHIERADISISNRLFCSQLSNKDIVYGTEENLLRTINECTNEHNMPKVMLVENSCATSLIGDDINSIVAKANPSYPVVPLDSGGLIGGFYEGYRAASLNFLEKIQFDKSQKKQLKTVNLLGVSTSYFNGLNDLNELKRILNLAGYNVIATLGGGSNLAEIERIPQAELNIVVHPELGLPAAEYLLNEYEIPFIVPELPYGLEASQQWIQQINDVIHTNLNPIKQEIENTEQFLFNRTNEFKSIWGSLWFDKGLISAPSSVARGLAKALRCEWVDMESLTLVFQDQSEQVELFDEVDSILEAEKDGLKVEAALKELENGILFGSSSEKSYLDQHNIRSQFCNVCLPVMDELLLIEMPFMGIKGSGHMLQRIWNQNIQLKLTNNKKG